MQKRFADNTTKQSNVLVSRHEKLWPKIILKEDMNLPDWLNDCLPLNYSRRKPKLIIPHMDGKYLIIYYDKGKYKIFNIGFTVKGATNETFINMYNNIKIEGHIAFMRTVGELIYKDKNIPMVV